jgi:alcohol dehydrogenase class IV
MNKHFNFSLKTNVKSGENEISNIPEFLKNNDFKRIGFMIDFNLIDKIKSINSLVDVCKNDFESVIVHYYKLKFEPTYQYLDKVKKEFKKDNNSLVDVIIGIGGGSSVDLAKGIATLITNHEPAINYRGFPENLNKSIPVIAVPSTAGTGTELAYNAVFIDEESNTKLGINTTNNYPILSVLDPVMVASAPQNVAIGSGIGALIRCFETLVSPQSNLVSKLFSREGFNLIFDSMPNALKNNEIDSWSKMQWGAYNSMAALLNSTSGPAGAISYYLSTKFDIPQGYGYGISGLKIAEHNTHCGYEGYSFLFNSFINDETFRFDELSKSKYVINKTKLLFDEINAPKNLKNFGVSSSDLDDFLHFCTVTAKGAFENNPINFNEESMNSIIKELIY